MFKTKKTKQFYFFVTFFLATFFVLLAGVAQAQTSKCQPGSSDVGGICMPSTTGLSEAPIYVILSSLFSWLMGLFTTFAVMAFVLSGVQYLTATGNDDMLTAAKSNMKNAFLGIIVGLSGFVLVRAISAALSGQSWFF